MHADIGDHAARRDDILAQHEGRGNAHGLNRVSRPTPPVNAPIFSAALPSAALIRIPRPWAARNSSSDRSRENRA
jgi:hypothetical protein